MVTSDSASRELEGVPFVPAGSEEQSRPLWPCGAPPSTMKLCSAPRRLRRFPHGTKQQARQHDEAVLSCLLLNTERSLRSAASFQRRSAALRAFACGENSLSCVRSERALASNLLEIEMTYAVVYGLERQHINYFCDVEDAYNFCEVVDGVVSDLDDEPVPYFDDEAF